jgi:hypothetical protein
MGLIELMEFERGLGVVDNETKSGLLGTKNSLRRPLVLFLKN